MYRDKKVLGVILARGGSKGFPGKNIAKLRNKPLLQWTIDAAKESLILDRLILSTDNDEIAQVALSLGCDVPFKRPEALARDDSPSFLAVQHAMDQLSVSYDYIVLLQPTSPLRLAGDIDECVKFCIDRKSNSCISVVKAEKPPHWYYLVNENEQIHPLLENSLEVYQRQKAPTFYLPNGAVYVVAWDWFKKNLSFLVPGETIAYCMPKERSIDVDDSWDLLLCESILIQQEQSKSL